MLSRRRARRGSEVLVAHEIERLIGKIERWIPGAPP
jgi:hypothetical protein